MNLIFIFITRYFFGWVFCKLLQLMIKKK